MKPLKSFVLLEKPEDKLRNRLIISGFIVFIVIIAYVIHGSVAYGLNKLENSGFEEGIHSSAVHLNTTEVDCAEGNKFKAYVVDSHVDRDNGLSIFSKIKNDEAMLFVFDISDKYSFWMKDMKFPIDILWLDHDKKIVGIENNIATSTYPEGFSIDEDSLYVLEFNAGIARKLNIKIGDVCNFDFPPLK